MPSKRKALAHYFSLKDCCTLPDQMPFVRTFPWRRFVLAMRDRHRAYQNKIAIFVFGVTAKDFSHGVLPDREDRRFISAVRTSTVTRNIRLFMNRTDFPM